MKRILITKNVAYSAKIGGSTISGYKEINLLDAGAIAIFTEDNRMLTAANANTVLNAQPDTKAIYIAVGSGVSTDGAKMSGLIDRETANVILSGYIAPVKQYSFIGDNGTSGSLNLPTFAAGASFMVRVVDVSAGTQPPKAWKSWEFVTVAGGSNTAAITALIAMINADPNNDLVTATVVGSQTGIKLTAKNFGQTFEMAVSGVLQGANLDEFGTINLSGGTAASISPTFGRGTAEQVAALEFECNPVEGDTNRVYQPAKWFTRASDVVTSTNYEIWVVNWTQKQVRPTGINIPSRPLVVLAIPSGATTIPLTTLGTIFTEAFGVNRINTETGS